jgi:hypothetical protein
MEATERDPLDLLIERRAADLSPREALALLVKRAGPLPSLLKIQLGVPDRFDEIAQEHAAIRCLQRLVEGMAREH